MPNNLETREVVQGPPTVGIKGPLRDFYDSIANGDYSILNTIETWWNVYSAIAIIFSLLFFVGFIYAKIRLSQIYEIEAEAVQKAEQEWQNMYETGSKSNTRWDLIQQRIGENNPESWRLAIIEADVFLEETLSGAGYVGQSIGEKLKSANTTSFTTLQDAWEAHKVRNEIAHAGNDFVLTQKIAQETIVRFGRVFKEFGVI